MAEWSEYCTFFFVYIRAPVCPSAKKKLSRYCWKLCECWKIRKQLCFYFCQTRTQKLSFPMLQWIAKINNPPLNASTSIPHCYQQLFFIHLKLHLKVSSQRVRNRYILSFQSKVGNRYIYDEKVFCIHIFLLFFLLCSHLCWKSWSFLLVVEHQ